MRLFYRSFTDVKDNLSRIIVVAYTHNRDTREVSYGASIFKKEFPSETFKKVLLRNTATERFKIRPVKFTSQIDPVLHISKIEDEIISHIVSNNYLVRSREKRTSDSDVILKVY